MTSWARPIISGLEEFKQSAGVYPVSLTELVPDYLDEIPQEDMHRGPWFYERTENGENFKLSMGGSMREEHVYYYIGDQERWELGTSETLAVE